MSAQSTQLSHTRELEPFLDCSYDTANSSLRWLSKQSISLQYYMQEEARKHYFKLLKSFPDAQKNVLSLASNLKVAKMIQSTYNKAHQRNQEFTSNDILLVNLLESNSFLKKERPSVKRKYILNHVSQIKRWKELGESWESISIKIETTAIDIDSISAEYIRDTISSLKDVS